MAPARGGRQTPDAGARQAAWPDGCLAADEECEETAPGIPERLRPGAGSAGWSALRVANSLCACASPPSYRAMQVPTGSCHCAVGSCLVGTRSLSVLRLLL